MATGDITLKYGTTTSLTVTGFNALASGSLATSNAIDIAGSINPVLDVLVEIVVAEVVEAGNKQIVVYAISSVDGTNFADNTKTSNLFRLGTLDITGTGPFRSQAFSVGAAYRTLPPQFKIVIYNDAGVSLAGSGNTAQYRFVYENVS
jgi:hypothetical protein